MDRYCRKCGNELQGDEKFCPVCGSEVYTDSVQYSDMGSAGERLSKKKTMKKAVILGVSCFLVGGIFLTGVFFSLRSKKADKNVTETKNQMAEAKYEEERGERSEEQKEKEVSVTEEQKEKKTSATEEQKEKDASTSEKQQEKKKESEKEAVKQDQDTQKKNVSSAEAEDAYIFPESSTEYLTDAQLAGLFPEELGIARNEIIARHGRIFTNEKYKSYFEGKSWYKGTIQPEVFDAAYEKQLNKIEKENIERIKKYEANASAGSNAAGDSSGDQIYSLAKEYYGDFLEAYKYQEARGFVDGPLELVNEMFFTPGFFPDGFKNSGITLYYTVMDLAGDGVPELFISDKETLYNAYGVMESEGQICPLFGDPIMGNRTHYTICENNLIRCEGSSGAEYNSIAYYRVEPHAYTAVCSEAVVQEGQKYYFATEDLYGFSYMDAASQSDYEALTVKYPEKERLQWLRLSDF